MRNQKFEQISIRDIVRLANVGHSTFYAHYADSDTVTEPVLIEFIAGGFMAVARWRVTEAPDKSVHDIHPLFVNLVKPLFSRKT